MRANSKKGSLKINWHFFWLVFLTTILVVVLYHQTFGFLFKLWTEWEDGEYSHGLLIILISFYLLYVQSKKYHQSRANKLDIRFVVLAAVLSLVWGVSVLINVHMVETFSVFALYVVVILALFSKETIRHLLFPLLYLFLAIPIWLPLLPILQDITVTVVYSIIVWLGIPVTLDGYLIQVPSGNFSIEWACSGLRYFLSALALSSLYAYLTFRSKKIALIFIAGALMLAIVANWLRVFLVIYVGYKTEMTHPWVHDHINLGWYIFAGMLFPYLWFGYLWSEKNNHHKQQITEINIDNNPVINSIKSSVNTQYLILLLTILIGPALNYIGHLKVGGTIENSLTFPLGKDGWVASTYIHTAWKLQSKGADMESHKRYVTKKGESVDVYIAHYAYSRDGAEPIDHSYRFFDSDRWYRSGLERKIDVGASKVIEMKVVSKDKSEERLVWYWYRVAGRVVNNIFLAKLYEGWGWLTGNGGVSILVISTDHNTNYQGTHSVLGGFIEIMGGDFAQFADDLN